VCPQSRRVHPRTLPRPSTLTRTVQHPSAAWRRSGDSVGRFPLAAGINIAHQLRSACERQYGRFAAQHLPAGSKWR